MGMGTASFQYALSSYFVKRRRKVAGVALAFTGLVSTVMPQLIMVLMETYGVQGTILLLGGMCSHSVAAAALLQPVKWHMKEDDGFVLKQHIHKAPIADDQVNRTLLDKGKK